MVLSYWRLKLQIANHKRATCRKLDVKLSPPSHCLQPDKIQQLDQQFVTANWWMLTVLKGFAIDVFREYWAYRLRTILKTAFLHYLDKEEGWGHNAGAQPSVNLVLIHSEQRHNERPALRTYSNPAGSSDTLLYWKHSRKDIRRHLFYLFMFFHRLLHSDLPHADYSIASFFFYESYFPLPNNDLWALTDSTRCRCTHGGNVRLCRDFNRIHLPVPAPPLHGGVRADVAEERPYW